MALRSPNTSTRKGCGSEIWIDGCLEIVTVLVPHEPVISDMTEDFSAPSQSKIVPMTITSRHPSWLKSAGITFTILSPPPPPPTLILSRDILSLSTNWLDSVGSAFEYFDPRVEC